MSLNIADSNRVRTLTLDRPEALNSFNEALYDALAEALIDAAQDPAIAVVLLTGNGRAFSADADLREMALINNDPSFQRGEHGFRGLLDQLVEFPKPLICAVNGIALGIGATVLGFAELTFMASTARLKCPFTDLGVAPEAASSVLLPALIGKQNAAWVLMSSEWIDAAQAQQMGMVWRVCEPDELLAEARAHAEVLAAKPISSLIAVKRTMIEPRRVEIDAARERENEAFRELMGGPANEEALKAFAEGRAADFTQLPPGW